MQRPATTGAYGSHSLDWTGPKGLVGQHLLVWHHVSLPPRLGVADSHQEAIRPSVEPRWVPKATDVRPDVEERLLRRILGETGVTQDSLGHPEQAMVVGDHERLERRHVAPLSLHHEVRSMPPLRCRTLVGDQRGDQA